MCEMLTIFTPTYNRRHILPRLYDSLCAQTSKDFVWLVVDDGSTDQTFELFEEWQKEKKINISFYKQKNQGKSVAMNKGINECKTKLFTCVDSDDYLVNEAVNSILDTWMHCHPYSIGILCLREVSKVPNAMKTNDFYTTLRDAYCKYGLHGDTMLVFRSDIIKRFQFPSFDGEKFVPEDYLYDKIDKEGKLKFLNKVLYKGQYLEDGYTAEMAKLIKNNPQGYHAFICQRLSYDDTLKQRILDTIRHIAINKVLESKGLKYQVIYPWLYALLYPLGYIFYCKRYKHL